MDFGFYSCKCQHSGLLPFMKFISFKSLDYVWMCVFCKILFREPVPLLKKKKKLKKASLVLLRHHTTTSAKYISNNSVYVMLICYVKQSKSK